MFEGAWVYAAQGLWGPDWIAPLSEVLGVNRRTVERWKSGEIDIPRHIAADLARLPRLGSATRAYGELLRRLARGERMDAITSGIADQRRALARLKADRGRYLVIAVLAEC